MFLPHLAKPTCFWGKSSQLVFIINVPSNPLISDFDHKKTSSVVAGHFMTLTGVYDLSCLPLREVGSTASLNASPIKLIDITRITIRTPAGIQSHGLEVNIVRDWAPFSIFPRLAVGG
jgi:hypothetical protein